MKKFPFFVGLLGMFVSTLATPVVADDCCWTADCCDACDGKFKVTADWLYWKVEQGNLGTATIVDTTVVDGTTILSSHTLRPEFEFNSGFRVGVGYEMPDCWELNVNYFYVPSKHKRDRFEITATEEVFLDIGTFPILVPFSLFPFTEVAASWTSNINNVDVDIGRKICFGECFYLYPHVGVRAFWINQKLRFAGLVEGIETSTLVAAKFREKFTGYGVEGGLKAVWQFCGGFGVFGHFGGAILYSKHKVEEDVVASTLIGELEPVDFLFADNHRHSHFGTPVFDYSLGIQYASNFCDFDLNVHVAWEQHVWLDVNQIARCGNLSAQGLTLGVEVGF